MTVSDPETGTQGTQDPPHHTKVPPSDDGSNEKPEAVEVDLAGVSTIDRAELRPDGDELDHQHEPPMTFNRIMCFVAMAFLWTASQIPVYLFGGVPPLIYGDIGGVDRWIWFVTGNLLGSAGICPFVGALSDLMGRRWVAVGGLILVMIGQIVCSTAQTMNIFIGKSSLTILRNPTSSR